MNDSGTPPGHHEHGIWRYSTTATFLVRAGVVFAPAYLGSFNPADPAANYLADGGLSSGAGGENITVTYSFEVASGAHFVIVAHEVEPGDGCVEYQLEVTGTGIVSADAAQAIGDLRDLVASMDIHHGIANALDAKLRAALAALEADDTAGACDSLQAFLNQVSAQSGKKLTEEQAEELTDAATRSANSSTANPEIQGRIGPVHGSQYAVWIQGSVGPPCALAKSKTARLSPSAYAQGAPSRLVQRAQVPHQSAVLGVSQPAFGCGRGQPWVAAGRNVNQARRSDYFYWQPHR